MQSLDKNHGSVTIRFKTEKDRVNGVYELYNSTIRSSSIGNHEYVVTHDHLDLFQSKDIKYCIIK
jgi:hypothetical protein